jgi:GAF domain-containing protein
MPDPSKQILKPPDIFKSDRLLAILNIIQAVNSAGVDVNSTYSLIVEAIKNFLGYPLVSLFMVDDPREKAFLRWFTGQPTSQEKQPVFSIDRHTKSAVSACLFNGKATVINKVTLLADDPRTGAIQGLQASAVLPFLSTSKMIGILEIHANSADQFSPAELEILALLVSHLSVLLQNAIRHSTIQRTVKGYRSIQEITKDLDQDPSAEEIIHGAVQMLSTFLPDGRITFLSPETRGNLRVRAYAGYAHADDNTLQVNSGGGAAALAASNLKPYRITGVPQDAESQGLSPDSRSILAVPVTFAGSLLGVFNIESPQVNTFSEDDLEIVCALANDMASVLSNISFVEQIRLQVERQKQLYEITNKIRHTVNIETIMRTSVEEICNTLNLPKATIRFNTVALSADETGALGLTKEKRS